MANTVTVAWGPGWELVLRSADPAPAEAYPRLANAARALDMPDCPARPVPSVQGDHERITSWPSR